jgi:hypothetical protein
MTNGVDLSKDIKSLGDFHEDVIRFKHEEFVDEHGRGFLIHHGPLDNMELAAGKKKTMLYEMAGDRLAKGFRPESDYLVFPLRVPALAQSQAMTISLGRSEANDVVIPESTISAFHAFIQIDEDGNLLLQDMNSTNGSFVNGQRVPDQDSGEPVPLRSGDRVRLGSMDFTCMMAAEFRKLVTGLIS